MMSIETTALYLSPATDLPLGLSCGFDGGPEKVSVLGIFREYVLYFSSCGFGAGAVRHPDEGSGGSWKNPEGGGSSCKFQKRPKLQGCHCIQYGCWGCSNSFLCEPGHI